jgi:hypothetical protein
MHSNYGYRYPYTEPWPSFATEEPRLSEPAKTPRERELQLQLEIQQTCLETVREATRLAELEELRREEKRAAH